MSNKNLKYVCRSCKIPKSAKFTILAPENNNGVKGQEIEILRDFESNVKQLDGTTLHKVTKTRQLECGHYLPTHYFGFTDMGSENLNEQEIAQIRRDIDREMIGKTAKELEAVVLFQVDQYQTLLKYHSKGKLASKYGIQYLDQIRERYAKTLSEDEKKSFETKFYHFLDLKPTTDKVKERERSSTERAADNQKTTIELALEQVKALYKKTGYSAKEAFSPQKPVQPTEQTITEQTVTESQSTTEQKKEGQ